ncbi:MAG: putative metal-binding protein [Solirubrobacteraceae bacterium]
MHPQEVAALVAAEFGDLRERIAARPDARVRRAELREPTLIAVEFVARVYQSEVVGEGVIVPVPGGFQQAGRRVPILGAVEETPLTLLVNCENWDGQPPECDLRRPDGSELQDWPKDPMGQGIVRGHPIYTRPFFCRPGTREYHSHPVHEDDPWDRYREGYTLDGIVAGLLEDLINRWTLA